MSDAGPETTEEPDDAEETRDGKRLEFSDTVAMETTKADLWSTISDPEVLTACVPGADEIDRVSKTKYTVDISIGVAHLNVSLSGDVEFVEMNEPDWIVASGSAFDGTTGSDFDILAAMEMDETDEGVDLSYTAEVEYTGGVASLHKSLLRPIVRKNVNKYFENIRSEVETDDE
ncbi:MAG: CoxG family protein [Halanaeroarchaeum sp.]